MDIYKGAIKVVKVPAKHTPTHNQTAAHNILEVPFSTWIVADSRQRVVFQPGG
jgi:hypothetical protein